MTSIVTWAGALVAVSSSGCLCRIRFRSLPAPTSIRWRATGADVETGGASIATGAAACTAAGAGRRASDCAANFCAAARVRSYPAE
jgi:hypothetical protein